MEASTMAHAGTMDLGGSAQAKQGGSRWPVAMLTLVVVVGTIAAVWFASSAGLVGGTTAKPAADRSFDAIEAQRGAVTLPGVRNQALNAYLDDILDRAHAAPAGALSSDAYLNDILDQAHAAPAGALSSDAYLNDILDRAHATPYTGSTATSGTLDPATAADQPVKRDRVGGP